VANPSITASEKPFEAGVPASLRLLFSAAVFLGAFLLFLMEPLIAKMILPWFGGTAAVWATCLVFFQSALLVGYWIADLLTRRLDAARVPMLFSFMLALSLLFLPIAPQTFWRTHAGIDPGLRILGLLTFSIGLPFTLLSTTSPLVQTWYARRAPSHSPYHLYALSNLASLLALLSFPFVIEPRWSSHQQSVIWSVGYAVFVVVCGAAACMSAGSRAAVRSGASPREEKNAGLKSGPYQNQEGGAPGWREKALWMGLAACGSAMLLAVTNHLAENVAPIPLLWVIPLALYLLSFAIVFAKRKLYSRWLAARVLAVMLGAAGYAIYDSTLVHAIQVSVPVFCLVLFIGCYFCHGELAERRPSPRYLTTFYLLVAMGGAIGSVCVALLAPHMLTGVYELPIVLLIAAALATRVLWHEGWAARVFWTALAGAMCAVLVLHVRSTREDTVLRSRDFYAALRVREYGAGRAFPYRELLHGQIEHGAQYLIWPDNRSPLSYYGRKSGVGLALRFCCEGPKRVGVIGLGTGTIAAYGKTGDTFRFYEIDPQVIRIAQNWFTYLKQSPAKIDIVLVDARLSLESEPSQNFDVLAVDAFSGDAIPVHLLTKEAFAIYFRHLKPNGILAVHVSNTYLDLTPVVKLLADDADYAARLIASDAEDEKLISTADWVLVTRNQDFLNVPEAFAGSENIEIPGGLTAWTDDKNNLFQVLRSLAYVTKAARE
jgi:hypothetical protein